MNAPYNEFSAGDVARMLKVDKSTVASWCRDGKIINKNISQGPHNARYLIPESEAEYLRKLCKQYGKRGIMKHYERIGQDLLLPVDKTSVDISKLPIEKPYSKANIGVKEELVDNISFNCDPNEHSKEVTTYNVFPDDEQADNLTPCKGFDVDTIALQIARIQEIKERINDIAAERNQLIHELEDLRGEVKKYI